MRATSGRQAALSRVLLAGWLAYAAYFGAVLLDGPQLVITVLLAGLTLAAARVVMGRLGCDAVGVLLVLAVVAGAVSTGWFAAQPPESADHWSLGEFGYLAFYPLVICAMVGLVRRQQVELGATGVLDVIIGAVVLAAIGAAVVTGELAGHESIRVIGHLGYLLADLGTLGFLLVAVVVLGGRALVALGGPALGMALIGAANAAHVVDLAEGPTATPTLVTSVWPAGLLLLALAGAVRQPISVPTGGRRVAVLLGSATACLLIVAISNTYSAQDVLALAALVLIIVRLGVSLIANLALMRRLEATAITDPLTGLANRTLLVDRLESALVRCRRHGGLVGVLFLDLDDFKALNDQHGHPFGDQVLLSVAQRLRLALRREDTVARARRPRVGTGSAGDTIGRLGGDEFVVLLEGIVDASGATVVAQRLLSELRAPLALDGVELFLDASIGVALGDGADSDRAADLLRDADTAMYVAKRSDRRDIEFFQHAMRDAVVARAELVQELRTAVAEGQFCLVYQPQVDLRSGAMVAVEALVRWDHPRRGRLAPDAFIPVAESSGTISDIDDWVLREACAQLRRWDESGLPELTMSVNVSARSLVSGALVRNVSAVCRGAGLTPRRLEVEITETVAVEHHDEAVVILSELRASGVRVAIDDFGMGHSALSRLQRFPVDSLKIDRSFVAPLSPGSEHESIAAAMMTMARTLGLEVIAEGIETDDHVQALRSLGCPMGQGYLFSRPVEAAEIEAMAGAQLFTPADRATLRRGPVDADALTRNLLSELQRLTDLESVYLTRIDPERAKQNVTHALNNGSLYIAEDLEVDWADTLCRRALEAGIRYTDDVPTVFPESRAAQDLGLQTYISVPLNSADGSVRGTLCGASSRRVAVGEQAEKVMEGFARLIDSMNG